MLVKNIFILAQTIATVIRIRGNVLASKSLSTFTFRGYGSLSNIESKRANFTSILPNTKGNRVVMYSNKSNDTTMDINIPTTTYEEVKKLSNEPEEVYLIDVREPDEIKETGQIPTSINIPLGDVSTVLSDSTSNDIFKTRFGKDKPTMNTPIIFYCRSGVRSQKASISAVALEYSNVRNYKGSWLEWSEKEGLSK